MSRFTRGVGWRLAVFAGLTALAAWRYAGVETGPPIARVIGLGATAVATGATIAVLRARWGTGARLATLAAALVGALLVAGVPARLLAPGRWGTLGGRLHGGLGAIGSTLWPYSGHDPWTRIDLMLVLAIAPIGAAAVAFWPARRRGPLAGASARVRPVVALALLLTVYVLGLLDSDGGSVTVEGLVLLGLIVAWLWLPELRRRRAAPALGWVAVAGGLAAVVTAGWAGGQPWLGYRGWNLLRTPDRGIAFSWDQSYGPLRWSRSPRVMFTVSAPRSQLWKTTTLDRFDGIRFLRSDTAAPADQDLPLPLNDRWYRFARFTIAGLSSRLLPGEQGVTAGVRIRGAVDYDPDGTVTTTARVPLPTGATYTVLSYVPDPTPADLRAAPRAFPFAYLRYTDFELPGSGQSGVRPAVTDRSPAPWLAATRTVGAPAPGLPPAADPRTAKRILASPYGPMYSLARRLARGEPSPYDVVLAVKRYLQANDAYDEHVPVRRYPLESFLFTDHIGYCQQFSGAMALLLRMNGIPARIAAGFLPGTYDAATHQWVVRAVDAHSWVEVYFSGIGWVPFDPTPARVAGTPQYPLFTSARAAAVTQMQAIAATVGGPLPRAAARTSPPQRRPSRGISVIEAVAAVAAIGLALVVLLGLAGRWLVGRARLRGSLGGDGELATRELVQALRRLGYAIPATATLSRVEAIVRLHAGPDAARYVRTLRDRRYGPGGAVAATLADRRRLRRGLTVRLGLDARLRGLWALPPGTVAWRAGEAGRAHPGGP